MRREVVVSVVLSGARSFVGRSMPHSMIPAMLSVAQRRVTAKARVEAPALCSAVQVVPNTMHMTLNR